MSEAQAKPQSEKKQSEILTHAEIKELLERNNLHPEIGRPVYIAWSDNRGKCHTQFHLDRYLKNFSFSKRDDDFQTWNRRINSKTYRMQANGAKESRTVTRPIRTSQGVWTEVPLNGK